MCVVLPAAVLAAGVETAGAMELVIVVDGFSLLLTPLVVAMLVLDGNDEDGSSDPAAALWRSAYCMLQRTTSLLAGVSDTQLVRRGQHASVVPSARLVQRTEFFSSQTEGWST